MDFNISYRKKDKGIQCIISYKENGKWKQKSKQGFEDSRKGKNEAKQWAVDMVKELEKTVKTPSDFAGITYKDFVYEYLDYKKTTISYNTYNFYKSALLKFDMLYDIKLTDINPLLIRKAYEKVKNENGINSTRYYYNCLRSMFKCAMEEFDLIIKNPCKRIKMEKKVTEKHALSFKEQQDLIEKLKNQPNMYVYISSLIALKCGLRVGEVLGLTWSDIDVINCELNVNKQWKKLSSGEYGFGVTKNKSVRKVPIAKEVIKELYRYKATIPISFDNRIVGTNKVSEQCRRAYRKAGYSISIHELRHTYTTNLIANGVDFKTAAALIGDTVEMVMKVYSHVNEDMIAKAKEIINTL